MSRPLAAGHRSHTLSHSAGLPVHNNSLVTKNNPVTTTPTQLPRCGHNTAFQYRQLPYTGFSMCCRMSTVLPACLLKHHAAENLLAAECTPASQFADQQHVRHCCTMVSQHSCQLQALVRHLSCSGEPHPVQVAHSAQCLLWSTEQHDNHCMALCAACVTQYDEEPMAET
jgi:hypothetical protein